MAESTGSDLWRNALLEKGKEMEERRSGWDAMPEKSTELAIELFNILEARDGGECDEQRAKDCERVREILACKAPGVHCNMRTPEYGEPLLLLAVHHSVEMVRVIAAAGADLNAQEDMAGETAMFRVREMLTSNADLDDEVIEIDQDDHYVQVEKVLLELAAQQGIELDQSSAMERLQGLYDDEDSSADEEDDSMDDSDDDNDESDADDTSDDEEASDDEEGSDDEGDDDDDEANSDASDEAEDELEGEENEGLVDENHDINANNFDDGDGGVQQAESG